MPLLFRNIRSGKRKALITDLDSIAKKAIEQALDSDVKPVLIKSHQIVVKDWEHQPKFQTRKDIKPDKISMTCFPTGSDAKIYIFVDKGTKPHTIPGFGPVKAKALRFQYGGKYIAKTEARPARTNPSGGKVVGGVTVFAKSVKDIQHPGSKAREFSETIAEDIKPDFKRIIENTFRKVSRQLEE